MKVGIIRCMQTEHVCPGTTDFKIAAAGKGTFEEVGPVEIVGFVSCGGCPGKQAVSRAAILKDRGAEGIAFASCISKGAPAGIGMKCPHFDEMKAAVEKRVGPEIKIFDYTH